MEAREGFPYVEHSTLLDGGPPFRSEHFGGLGMNENKTSELQLVQNRLLAALDAEDQQLLLPHLVPVTLEKGALLYDPGDMVDTVYFPDDCVISLMTLMET